MSISQGINKGRKQLVGLGVWLTFGAVLAQLIIEFSVANFAASVLALVSWPIALGTFLGVKGFSRNPLPSLVVTGFWSTQIILPIIATALEGRPATYNLQVPGLVILHNGLIFLVLVLAWTIHTKISVREGKFTKTVRRCFYKLGIYEVPTPRFLYFIGCIGLTSMFYIYFFLPSLGVEASGAGQKLIQGLIPMTYAPYLLLYGKMYGSQVHWKRHVLALGGFSFCLLVVALGFNSRAAFMDAALFGGTAFLTGVFGGVFRTRIFSSKVLVVGILGLFLIMGPIADLATAMVLVRAERDDIARNELVELTWDAYLDKERIAEYRKNKQGLLSFGQWDERYLSNPLLSRFCNLKFADLSLDLSRYATKEASADFRQFSYQRLLATYPRPLIGLFGLRVDKDYVMSGSHGDYLFTVAGSGSGLGGFKTGHMAGTGMTAFGWGYLVLLGVGVLVSFVFLGWLQPVQGNRIWKTKFSALGLLYLTPFFMMFPCESVVMVGSFIMRGFWEMVFLYGILWLAFSVVTGMRSRGRMRETL